MSDHILPNAGGRQLQRHETGQHSYLVRQLALLRGTAVLAASPVESHSSAEGCGSMGVYAVRFPAEKKKIVLRSVHVGSGTDPVNGYESPELAV